MGVYKTTDHVHAGSNHLQECFHWHSSYLSNLLDDYTPPRILWDCPTNRSVPRMAQGGSQWSSGQHARLRRERSQDRNRAADSFCVFHENHCNAQLLAWAAHLLQYVDSLPPSKDGRWVSTLWLCINTNGDGWMFSIAAYRRTQRSSLQLGLELAATWRWPTFTQMNRMNSRIWLHHHHQEHAPYWSVAVSTVRFAVDNSTVNIILLLLLLFYFLLGLSAKAFNVSAPSIWNYHLTVAWLSSPAHSEAWQRPNCLTIDIAYSSFSSFKHSIINVDFTSF